MALSEQGHTVIVVPDPTSAHELDHSNAPLHAEVTVVGAVVFFAAMTLSGWAIGKVLGDEYQLIPGLAGPPAGLSDAEALTKVEDSLTRFERADPVEGLDDLLAAISGPKQVGYLFSEGRMLRLFKILDRPATSFDPSQRDFLPQVYRLLGRVGTQAEPRMQLDILGTMCRDLPQHKRLAHQILVMCRKSPDLWNDAQGPLEDLAAHDPSIARLMEKRAGSDQAFVARANDAYMTDMTRFRRLAEDRGVIGTQVVDWELNTMLEHEFAFLKASGSTSKRFVWIAPEARRLIDMLEGERLELLHEGARAGNRDCCAVLGQLVLAWARGGFPQGTIQETVDVLGDAAAEHATAADALIGIFKNIRGREGGEPSKIQKRTRHLVFDALIAASEASYEVLSLLASHGIHANMYEDDSDEMSQPVPVKVESSDPLRSASAELEELDIEIIEPTDGGNGSLQTDSPSA